MGLVLLTLLAYALLALIEAPRLWREGRRAELWAFGVLLGLSLPLSVWAAAGGTVPPVNEWIRGALQPVGRLLTGLLQ